MFTVYKITNNINNKCYIGSSINVKQRWRAHKTMCNQTNSKQYNYPLYCAFRKYGVDNFTFEVLRDNFNSLEEMWSYEKEMIHFYNATKNGYNQTDKAGPELSKENSIKSVDKRKQSCVKIDCHNNILEQYDSYHEAARMNGYDSDRASAVREVCKGISNTCFNGMIFRDYIDGQIIEKQIKPWKNKKQVVAINVENPEEELYFNSISDASKYFCNSLNLRSSINKCINGSQRYSVVHGYIFREINTYGDIVENGIAINERIEKYNKLNPVINGERKSIIDWCKHFGITKEAFYARKRKGMSTIEALTTPKKR